MVALLNARDCNMALVCAARSGTGPSCDDAIEETDTEVEIVEEGEEGETAGPVPAAVRGQTGPNSGHLSHRALSRDRSRT
jgi:hypothetical protein